MSFITNFFITPPKPYTFACTGIVLFFISSIQSCENHNIKGATLTLIVGIVAFGCSVYASFHDDDNLNEPPAY